MNHGALPSHDSRWRLVADALHAFAEATTDYQLLLDTIVRRTAEVIGGFCAISLVSDDGERVDPVALYDVDAARMALWKRLLAAVPMSIHARSAITRVIETGEQLLMPEVGPEQLRARFGPENLAAALGLDMHCSLMTPLRVDGRSIGVLSIVGYGRDARPIDGQYARMARDLADHAALAITNARLIADGERLTDRLRAISEVSRELSSATGDYRQLVDLVARRIAEFVGDLCVIRLLSDDREWLEASESVYHRDPELLAAARKLIVTTAQRVGDGVMGKVAATGQSMLVAKGSAAELAAIAPPNLRPLVELLGTTSVIAVPLKVHGQVIGVAAVSRNRPDRPYVDDDRRLLEDLGAHAAAAISNARSLEELRASQARYARLAESGLIGITIAESSGRIREANDAYLGLLGYSREDLKEGRIDWKKLTPPDWAHQSIAMGAQLMAHGVTRPFEKEYVRKDGSRVPVLIGLAKLQGETNITICVDLSERKKIERALIERSELAELTADVGVALTQGATLRESLGRCVEAVVRRLDVAFAWVWTLDAARGLLELQAGAGAHGAPIHPVDPVAPSEPNGCGGSVPVGECLIGVIARDRRAYFTNEVVDDPSVRDRQWVRREGIVAFAGYPLLVGGDLVGVVAIFARRPLGDLARNGLGAIADTIALGIRNRIGEAARQTLEAQLRHAQKMEAVGQLAGGVAHDFNNLLSVILSYTDLAIADLTPHDPLRSDLEEIKKAGLRAAGLTRQLLAFSRQQVLEPKVLDLNEIIMGMNRMIHRLVGEDVELVMAPARTLGKVKADPGHLEQIIMNLVVNARDAMPKGGRLTIETQDVVLDGEHAKTHVGVTPGPHALLAVSDTGVGMDQATQERIFEPFFTTKDKAKGTGLGLSTVFGIVKQSGGSIRVSSEPGAGTTFEIYLPVTRDSAATAPMSIPVASLRGSESILLVEDEEQLRVVARGVLQKHGYRVIDACNGGEALMICETHEGPIHLLLTDVVMPQMNGRELATRLASLRPDMHVLFMSGYAENAIVHNGVLDPGISLLQKPITPEGLLRKVREVLDEPQTKVLS